MNDTKVPHRIVWTEAIKAYEQETERLRKPFRNEFEEIINFVTGHDWILSLRLLKASGEAVPVGCEEIGSAPNHFFGQDGFFTITKTKAELEEDVEVENIFQFSSKLAKEDSASKIARAFRNLHEDRDVSFHYFIYKELERIAKASPKQK